MESTINNGMCRCCASEGTFKDVKSSYHWMGEEEIYSDMLRECFDVSLLLSEDGNDGGICEVCITQLRNAANFKKQVQHTEEQFKLRLDGKLYKSDSIVKIEPSRGEDDDNDSDNMSGDDFSGAEYEVPIKTEKLEETKPKKRPATSKPSTSRAKKTKNAEPETSTKRKTGTTIQEKMEPDNGKQLSEMEKQWHNLTTLLKYSNATPFKDRTNDGYICTYCFKAYPDPEMLRRHNRNNHIQEKPAFQRLSNFVAYLDIMKLKCTICSKRIENIKVLTEHLVGDHGKKYYLGLTDYFQPFKLTSETQVKCCLCNDVFDNLKVLIQHMNVHFRNFICTICGAGFVNVLCLNKHETTHGKKGFLCRHCGLVFPVESQKKAHVYTEHKGIAGDSICRICGARFKNYYQKVRHMAQEHDVESLKCDICEKRFHLKANLMLHMRCVHLKERRFECPVCAKGFFEKRHMSAHYLSTHTNERQFKCELCDKAYATQHAKQNHKKIIHAHSQVN